MAASHVETAEPPVRILVIDDDIEFCLLMRDFYARHGFDLEATPFDRSVDVHIHHLRKKLGGHRTPIKTVRGEGYLFCPD